MKIFDVKKNAMVSDTKGEQLFIVGTLDELKDHFKDEAIHYKVSMGDDIDRINYNIHLNYDHFNFTHYVFENQEFMDTNLNLLMTSKHLIYVVEDEALNKEFIKTFEARYLNNDLVENNIQEVFYLLMSMAFKQMFDSLFLYESYISEVEDTLLMGKKKSMDLKDVVEMKNQSLEIKKYNRQLLYVGDLLLVNDGHFKINNRYARNLNSSINKLYDYANNVYEMCNHLMELYDSKMSANTNDVINKLTIFTVFATPLTVITGIYGMNFVNMPELQHAYGYYIAIGVMIVIDLIIYFVLKKIKLL